jgi:hypothetical protein
MARIGHSSPRAALVYQHPTAEQSGRGFPNGTLGEERLDPWATANAERGPWAHWLADELR